MSKYSHRRKPAHLLEGLLRSESGRWRAAASGLDGELRSMDEFEVDAHYLVESKVARLSRLSHEEPNRCQRLREQNQLTTGRP
jgi:hypothetical protein